MPSLIPKKIGNINLDATFAYHTPKLVLIESRYLGIIKLLMTLGIFLYIFVYELFYLKSYLLCEAPTASTLVSGSWNQSFSDEACLEGNMIRNPSYTYNHDFQTVFPSADYAYCDSESGVSGAQCRDYTQVEEVLVSSQKDYAGVAWAYTYQWTGEYVDTGDYYNSTDSEADYYNSAEIRTYTETYYVRGVENFHLSLNPEVITNRYVTKENFSDTKVGGGAINMAFELLDQDNKVMQGCTKYKSVEWSMDDTCQPVGHECKWEEEDIPYISMSTLLGAAGANLDDNSTSVQEICEQYYMQQVYGNLTDENYQTIRTMVNVDSYLIDSFLDITDSKLDTLDKWREAVVDFCTNSIGREASMSLLVVMDFTNMGNAREAYRGPFRESTIQCKIKVSGKPNMPPLVSYKGVHPDQSQMDDVRVRAFGASIIISHTGEICVFNFSTLLLTLTTSITLLAVASTITDFLMLYVLPMREFCGAQKRQRVTIPKAREYQQQKTMSFEDKIRGEHNKLKSKIDTLETKMSSQADNYGWTTQLARMEARVEQLSRLVLDAEKKNQSMNLTSASSMHHRASSTDYLAGGEDGPNGSIGHDVDDERKEAEKSYFSFFS